MQQLALNLMCIVIFGLYWSPMIAAVLRRHPRLGLVAILNLFGITGIAWVYAWALVLNEPSHKPPKVRKTRTSYPEDPTVTPLRKPGRSKR